MRRQHRDEYDEIYGEVASSGFIFGYGNHRLSGSQMISQEEMAGIPDTKRNGDAVPMYVTCTNCGQLMDFTTGNSGTLNGNWTCPNCRKYVRESTVYHKMEKENAAWYDRLIGDDEPSEFTYDDGDDQYDWSDL